MLTTNGTLFHDRTQGVWLAKSLLLKYERQCLHPVNTPSKDKLLHLQYLPHTFVQCLRFSSKLQISQTMTVPQRNIKQFQICDY